MIKKTLITSLVGFVLLFVSINAKAATFTDDQMLRFMLIIVGKL